MEEETFVPQKPDVGKRIPPPSCCSTGRAVYTAGFRGNKRVKTFTASQPQRAHARVIVESSAAQSRDPNFSPATRHNGSKRAQMESTFFFVSSLWQAPLSSTYKHKQHCRSNGLGKQTNARLNPSRDRTHSASSTSSTRLLQILFRYAAKTSKRSSDKRERNRMIMYSKENRARRIRSI